MKRVLLSELRSIITNELQMMHEASVQGRRLRRGMEFEYEGKRYRYDGPAKNNVGARVHRVTDLQTKNSRSWNTKHFSDNVKSGKIKLIDQAQNEQRLRRLVREAIDGDWDESELSELEPGDMVDVMSDVHADLTGVKVISLFDSPDHDASTGYGDDSFLDGTPFDGPGFLGRLENGEEVAVPLDHVVPGSKAKYYFPNDVTDDYGRDVPNPYRRMAGRNAISHIERGP